MGTNFYLITKEKDVRDRLFGGDYELTDQPYWAYSLHIAKTSMGWLPLFQASEKIKSVKDIEKIYGNMGTAICDEYGEVFTWSEFENRVLKFNGGIKGVQKRELINGEYIPISHFEYNEGEYKDKFFTDEDGYEFAKNEFF